MRQVKGAETQFSQDAQDAHLWQGNSQMGGMSQL